MKKTMITVLACTFLAVSAWSQTNQRLMFRGGEAGSGTDLTRVDNFELLHSRMYDAIAILQEYYSNAAYLNLTARQQREELVEGLRMAARVQSPGLPLTMIAIQRGLVLDQQFSGNCTGSNTRLSRSECESLKNRAARHFLAQYYSHILNSVYPLDRDYYVPWHSQYNRCSPWEDARTNQCGDVIIDSNRFFRNFYTDYLGAARSLLGFYVGEGEGRNMPWALGTDLFQASVGSRVLEWAGSDLRIDLFNRGVECVASNLERSHWRLDDYLSGLPRKFNSARDAGEFAFHRAHQAMLRLEESYPCDFRRFPW